jgi:hypothetical protein
LNDREAVFLVLAQFSYFFEMTGRYELRGKKHPLFYSCQVGRKNYWLKDFRYLKPKRASVTRIYDVIDLEYV